MKRTRNAKRFLLEYAAYIKNLHLNSFSTDQEKAAIVKYIDTVVLYVDRGLMTNTEAVQVIANMDSEAITAYLKA